VRVRAAFAPRVDGRGIYDELYGVFRCLHSRLAGACHRLNSGLECAGGPG